MCRCCSSVCSWMSRSSRSLWLWLLSFLVFFWLTLFASRLSVPLLSWRRWSWLWCALSRCVCFPQFTFSVLGICSCCVLVCSSQSLRMSLFFIYLFIFLVSFCLAFFPSLCAQRLCDIHNSYHKCDCVFVCGATYIILVVFMSMIGEYGCYFPLKRL